MSYKCKVVLTSKSSQLPLGDRFPLVGIGYLISYIRKHIPSVEILFVPDKGDVAESVARLKPDIVGISSATPNFVGNLKLAHEIRLLLPDAVLLIGGPHVSAAPWTLRNTPFDYGVLGEGEETLREILFEYIHANKRSLFDMALKKVKGIVWWDELNVHSNQRRDFIEELDSIPHPDIEALHAEESMNNLLITSRGCPYSCIFCSSSQIWCRTIRFHSASYVAQEIEERYKRYGIKMFYIKDDLFTVNKERLQELVVLLEEKGLSDVIFPAVKARANLMTDELCALLKSLHVVSVNFGFESASQRILSLIKDGPADISIYERAIKMCTKHGIDAMGTFIIGNPNETSEDVQRTYDFIRKHPICSPMVFIASPYPSTKLWDMAKERGLVNDDIDWTTLTQNRVFFTDEMTADEIYEWKRKFDVLYRQKRKALIYRRIVYYLVRPHKTIKKIIAKAVSLFRDSRSRYEKHERK